MPLLRLVLRFEGGVSAVVHLMILGRLHWKKPGAAIPKGSGLCAFDFESGSLLLTESGKQRRASLHLVADEAALAAFDRGGLEVMNIANEANYCARCQTGGRLLADRALSRLLHDSWPRSIDEL